MAKYVNVTVYDEQGRPVEMKRSDAIKAIEAGTYKAYGRKAFDVPGDWLSAQRTSQRRYVPVEKDEQNEEPENVEAAETAEVKENGED